MNPLPYLDGYKTYIGIAVVLLSALPWWDDQTRRFLFTAGIGLAGIGLRHAVAKTTPK